MYKDNKIGIVIPVYNEKGLILDTLCGIPKYVDAIFVVDDASTDSSLELVQQRSKQDSRIQIIKHETNKGLGKTLIDGYIASRKSDINITAVMAGDNQMDPDDLPLLLDKIIEENSDYAKGNRLLHQNVSAMPKYRFFGNALLTILTKFATGYYFMMDPQCGYTAIKNSVLRAIPIEKMTQGYGYNADILCMLNIQRFQVTDVQVKPVYGREKSKIRLWRYMLKTSWLLVRLFFRRLWQRYIILDFHPLTLFYVFALFNTIFIIIPFTIRFFVMYSQYNELPKTTLTILILTFLISFQSILFAIWMDMDYNRDKK
jgi:glycosyltransferase involved in cell wall biosynthesis